MMDTKQFAEYLLTPAAQIALIIGLAEICKKIGVPTRWIPLIDLGLGLISGIGVFGLLFEYGIPTGIVIGIAIGLSACGLFSGARATFKASIPEMPEEPEEISYEEIFKDDEDEEDK